MTNASNTQNVINHIRKRKQDLVRVLGGQCRICGFNKFVEALEFHHINPDEKEFGIGASNAATKALDKQLAEVRKCILLCSNCHKGFHAGILSLPEDPYYFDEKIANELLEENYRLRHGIERHCKKCGKIISRDAEYCVDCVNIQKRIVERPTRDQLKDEIRTIPFTQLARKYGVTDNSIKKWCIAYNLPSKKSIINTISDTEWLNI